VTAPTADQVTARERTIAAYAVFKKAASDNRFHPSRGTRARYEEAGGAYRRAIKREKATK